MWNLTPNPDVPPLALFVAGLPAAQGSKRHVGKGIMVENSKKLTPWRETVKHACVDARGQPLRRFEGVALRLTAEFILYRPAYLAKKRATPPAISVPDLSKLIRAIEDAMTDAGVIKDDALFVELITRKRRAELGEATGVKFRITELEIARGQDASESDKIRGRGLI